MLIQWRIGKNLPDCPGREGSPFIDGPEFPNGADQMIVVAKSDYDRVSRELDKYKTYIPEPMKPSEIKLSQEVNRLLAEINRLQNLLDKARLMVDQANHRGAALATIECHLVNVESHNRDLRTNLRKEQHISKMLEDAGDTINCHADDKGDDTWDQVVAKVRIMRNPALHPDIARYGLEEG